MWKRGGSALRASALLPENQFDLGAREGFGFFFEVSGQQRSVLARRTHLGLGLLVRMRSTWTARRNSTARRTRLRADTPGISLNSSWRNLRRWHSTSVANTFCSVSEKPAKSECSMR